MSAHQTGFTLAELAQIALGAPQMNKINLTVLHKLFDLLLKKLDCEHETVTISGHEAKCFGTMLKESKIPALSFNDEKLIIISEKLKEIETLEKRICISEANLENHFEEVKERQKALDLHTTFCEDLCTTCDPEHEFACTLLRNSVFMRKMFSFVSDPMLHRMSEYENKIEVLKVELEKFIERAEKQYAKVNRIDKIIHNIEILREIIDQHYKEFIATLEELQDMLDAKVDKLHIPPLKAYVAERFELIESMLKKLHQTKACPKALAFVMENSGCAADCVQRTSVRMVPTSNLPARPSAINKSKPKTFCGCEEMSQYFDLEARKTAELELKKLKEDISAKYPNCFEYRQDKDGDDDVYRSC